MRVVPIASTMIRPEGWDLFAELGFNPYLIPEIEKLDGNIYAEDIDILPEFAGRNCYQSFPKPNPATAKNSDYLKNTVVDLQHESILEHSSVTFFARGISRNLLLELERHRHISFSVISTRYVPPTMMGTAIHPNTPRDMVGRILDHDAETRKLAESIYLRSRVTGLEVKEAREVARQVLAGNTETIIVVTGNLRAWRYIINLRWHPKADKEIHNFAEEILKHLKDIAPNSVQDFPDVEDIDL